MRSCVDHFFEARRIPIIGFFSWKKLAIAASSPNIKTAEEKGVATWNCFISENYMDKSAPPQNYRKPSFLNFSRKKSLSFCSITIHPWSLTARPWKMMGERLHSFCRWWHGYGKMRQKNDSHPIQKIQCAFTKHRTLTHSCEPLNFHKKTQQIFTRWAPTIVINGVPTPISRVMLPIYVRPEKRGPITPGKYFPIGVRRRTWARGPKINSYWWMEITWNHSSTHPNLNHDIPVGKLFFWMLYSWDIDCWKMLVAIVAFSWGR